MPLITGSSRESFSHNVKTEIAAGRPQKQSVAIAYAKKREAEKRRRGVKPAEEEALAMGGIVEDKEDEEVTGGGDAAQAMPEGHVDQMTEEDRREKKNLSLAKAWARKRGF